MFPSFPRKWESSLFRYLQSHWIPVFTGMTTFYETIINYYSKKKGGLLSPPKSIQTITHQSQPDSKLRIRYIVIGMSINLRYKLLNKGMTGRIGVHTVRTGNFILIQAEPAAVAAYNTDLRTSRSLYILGV